MVPIITADRQCMYIYTHNESLFSTSKFSSPRITNEQPLAAPKGVPIMASFLPVKTCI